MLLLHGIAVLATVCSTVLAFSLRPHHEEFENLSASRRSQRHATGFQSGGSSFHPRLRARESVQMREYVRPRRTPQTTPKSFQDQDLFAIESPIFNAPLPVSSSTGFRRRRNSDVPHANIIQLNPTYRRQGIQQTPVRDPFHEPQGVVYNKPNYRQQVASAEENQFIKKVEPVLHQKTDAPSVYRLTGVRAKGPRPTMSFAESEDARFAQPQGNGNIGNIRFIQEVPPTKLTFEESETDNENYHPNHRYRDEAEAERKPHTFALQSQRDAAFEPQSDEPQQHRAQIPKPAIEDFQAKQEEELLYYRQQQEQRRQKEEQLQGLLNQYKEQESVEIKQKESVPYFEDESVEEERRVIPENPKVSQAVKIVREERLPSRNERFPASDEQLSFSNEQIPDRQERNSVRHEPLPVRNHPNAARQESIPVRHEPSPTRPQVLPVRHQPNPAEEEPIHTRREPPPTRHEALPARHKQLSASQERPIVTLKPVYPKNYKPEHQVKQPIAFDRPDYENEPINFLPEYRQSFENNQPIRSHPNGFKDPSPGSKEKRQAHHGDEGYIDNNGVEFAAAASAAEAAHGHGGDGRLTFQLHGQKGPHSYRFGFDTGKGPHRQFRYEERDNDGTVKGRYGYYDSHGKLQMYNYSAHPEHGYSAAEAH